MANKILMIVIVASMTSLIGCAENSILQANSRVGVIGFQQCRPDLTLKEIGLDDISARNEAAECSRKGMPVVFATELKNRLQEKMHREVQIVALDVPYNYNIQSQIDIAKRNNIDFFVGGMLERYIDVGASQRAKQQGILPNTAVLSPKMEKTPKTTVVKAHVMVVRTADRAILADLELDEDGEKSGDIYTSDFADKISHDVFKVR